MFTLKLKTAPTTEPISTAEAKSHLRIDTSYTNDDTYIDNLIKAARQHVENITSRAIITQTYNYYLDDFPTGSYIKIPRPSLQSITSIKYTDEDSTENTFSTSNYVVDTDSEPGRVILDDDTSWPTDTLLEGNAIDIEFDAGYGDDSSSVPETVRQAMLILISHWYENREPVLVGTNIMPIKMSVDALLANYKINDSYEVNYR